ncbi:MCE family protein [Tsukamurella ocularis]|uniref:MCE family protein n=1 Tax=Tsukamurella ocularis TaxID=1970234 RepID=UPI002168847B|nr:MCE family protein [Tsukamurella ocularis]MCS3779429.1 phospholipid/cholesterol/gamma-HCH transport system substrate-binding protein [Tsukamurella ocularis]MCS3788097.1 phospholipid/cholesterol/gamma-HCH transport system substrate-binding protein [Tsukamurella ocularis]MCS3852413.1 phospholipid/cholesterol/gamma-HCH transport system substrate-binding protein [Tsukamurella ocularis]
MAAERSSTAKTAFKVGAFAMVMLLLLWGVLQLLTRPVTGAADSYTALFSNVSGLRVGDDVRLRGVPVGKVQAIAVRQDGRDAAGDPSAPVAEVRFSALRTSPPTDRSAIAIRYQNLTGTRFVDITEQGGSANGGASTKASPLVAGATIGVDRTTASFDITTIFHGLRPVLKTLQPDEVNLLMQSALTVIQGDGKGIGTLLQSIDQLSTTINSKQSLLTGLIANLGTLAGTLGGNSAGLASLLRETDQTAGILAGFASDVRTWSDESSQVLVHINQLLSSVGLTKDGNPGIVSLADGALTTAGQLLDIASMIPAISAQLGEPAVTPRGCSRGRAALPPLTSLFVAGQEVIVCNAP